MTDSTTEPVARPDWFDLFYCFRMACDPVKVWLGFLGAAFTILMLVVAAGVLLNVEQHRGGAASRRALRCIRSGDAAGACKEIRSGAARTWADLKTECAEIRAALFNGRLMRAVVGARTVRKVGLWALVVLLLLWLPWAYFGGAISRSAAVEYATGERIRAVEAREFAASQYSSNLWAPVVLVLTAAGLFVCGALVALAAAHLVSAVVLAVGLFLSLYALVVVKQKVNSNRTGVAVGMAGVIATAVLAWGAWGLRPAPLVWVGKLIVVAAYPLLMLLAVPVLFLLLVVLFGRGLMVSCGSYQGTDAFDAVARSGDYLLRRPWHLAFYTLVAVAYGLPCLAVVALFAFGGFTLASLMAWAGFGGGFEATYQAVLVPEGGDTLFGPLPGFLLRVVFALLCGLVAGWCVSFLQSARVVCYALLRKQLDQADPSEIYLGAGRLPPAPDATENAGAVDAPQTQT